MRTVTAAIVLSLAAVQPGVAETCQERFTRLLIDGNGDDPVKIHVTQEIKGGATSKNYFYQRVPGHWMTEMIEPADQDWALTHDNVLYTSSDKGKSWKKARAVDSAATAKASKESLMESAKTVTNAACGQEELDGATYDTVEADFETLRGFKTKNHYKYWVDPASGYISKATYDVKAKGFESFTTQLVAPAPDLTLPTPE